MSKSLFWFINNQTCPADGTHLGKPTKRLRSHRGDLKLRVWTCPLCERDFVEYPTGYDVLRRFPEIGCRFLDLDIPIVNKRKLVEMNNETQIIGQKVNHISFGYGIVTSFSENWIDIHFDSEQRDIVDVDMDEDNKVQGICLCMPELFQFRTYRPERRSLQEENEIQNKEEYSMSKKENGYEMIINDQELMAMFEKAAEANGRTGEEVLATFIKDYVVCGGRPELVDDSRS